MSAQSEWRVAALSWDAVGRRLAAGVAAVLPIGAGAKQHGLHLPMNTDQLQAEWLAGEVAAAVDALIWPTLTYGHYPAFTAYAGSLSLSAGTFRATVRELVLGLIGFGARTVLVLDTGISTIGPVEEALAAAPPGRAHHLRIYEGPRYRAAVARLAEQAFGSHADELETARMLVLAPDQVAMARAQASPVVAADLRRPGALTPDDPTSPNYSPSGSFGDPTLATAEKGEVLLEAMREDVLEAAGRAIAGRGTGRA